ncbi:hypothetical protein DIE18_37710, partial [Burkholderia sp. Bp9125]
MSAPALPVRRPLAPGGAPGGGGAPPPPRPPPPPARPPPPPPPAALVVTAGIARAGAPLTILHLAGMPLIV